MKLTLETILMYVDRLVENVTAQNFEILGIYTNLYWDALVEVIIKQIKHWIPSICNKKN